MSSSANLSPVDSSVMIPLEQIPTDAQTRVQLRAAVVRDYAAAMVQQIAEGGLRFPPVVLFTDGHAYWLADGSHRTAAARKAGLTEFPAQVRPGTPRDALLYGISANSAHGLPRSNADKRKAVALLLADPEWSQWSDREIGRRCQVGHAWVSRLRRSASVSGRQIKDRKVRRQDVVYEMKLASSASAGETSTAARRTVPLADALGLGVPEAKANVFAALGDFEEANHLFDRLAKLLDRIAQGPAGAIYRQEMIRTGSSSSSSSGGQVVFDCTALRRARGKLAAAQPYCGYCPNCHAASSPRLQAACKKCGGRGWTTRAAFESCLASDRERLLKLRNTVPSENADSVFGLSSIGDR
jgi:hypothetical protein